MRLISIKLTNAGLHREIEVEFEPGLIMLCGPQGSGKSTLMNMSYAALTNDFSRIVDGKEGAVCQQAADYERSEIILKAEHNGTPFTIQRLLAPGTRSRLQIGGEPAIVKANEIQKALDDFLGIDRQILDKYIFVQQWGVRDLSQQTPAERAKTLARLCGTEWAELCWETVNRQLIIDEAMLAGREVDLDALRLRVMQCREALDQETANLEAACAKIILPEETSLLEDEKKKLRRYEELAGQLQTAALQESKELAKAKEAAKTAKSLRTSHETLEAQTEEEVAQLTQLKVNAEIYDARRLDWERKQTAQQQSLTALSNLESEKAAIAAIVEPSVLPLEELTQKREALLAEASPYSLLTSRLRGLGGQAVCPTCNQTVHDVEAQLASADAALAAIRDPLAQVDADIKLRQQYNFDKQKAETRLNNCQLRVDNAAATLESLLEVGNPGARTSQSLGELNAQLAAKTAAVRSSARFLSEADKQAASSKAVHQATQQRLDAMLKEQVALSVDPVTYRSRLQEIEERLALGQQAARDAAALEASCTHYRTTLTEREAELTAGETAVASRVNARRWIAALRTVQDVLHRDKLPSLVHRQALQRMESGVNEMLGSFESPFRVTAAEDLSYTAKFGNGTIMPDKGLSGGEQVILSVARRWALNSMFAGQVGMLVLDEPTAGLDERNIELLERAFLGLGELALAKNFQVIIITHDARLERAFNQVIRLQRPIQ